MPGWVVQVVLQRPWLVPRCSWETHLLIWSSMVYTAGLCRELLPDASGGTDDVVLGATFGPGYSLLCSPGPATATATTAAAAGPSAASPLSAAGESQVPQGHRSNLTSFTFCAFVRIHKSRKHSPLLTYTERTWTATVDVTRLGVALQVLGSAEDQVFQYFFEAKLPPGVWRHLCLQFNHHLQQVLCFVDGVEEPLSLRQKVTAGGDGNVMDTAGEAVRPAHTTVTDNCTARDVPGDDTLAGTGATGKQEVVGGVVCVGGTLEAEVAGVAVWGRPLPTQDLALTSGCGRQQGPEEPDVVLQGRGWCVAGDVTLRPYHRQHLCPPDARLLLVQPTGTYDRHVTLCDALGGGLLPGTALTPALMALARGTRDSCLTRGDLLTWLRGGHRAANGSAAKVKNEEECPVLGVGGRAWAACELRMECSMCQVSSTVLYNLYGHDGRLYDHTYQPYHSREGHLRFRGLGGSEILRQGAGWLLRSSLHQTTWLLAQAPVPVGRHRWSAAGQEVVLTLTHCRTTQFACDDGQCVPQTDRCDDIVHCRDRSDEANCQVVERPPGYDPYYTPPPRPGEVIPIDLDYHIDVYNVGDVTTKAGVASMDVGITMAWYDPRLKFLNLKPAIKNYFPCPLVWTPRVRVVSGSGEGNLLNTNDYEKFCYTYDNDETEQRPLHDPLMGHQADGSSHAVELYLGVLAWVPCRFHLQMYPFDVQLCNLSFMVVNAPSSRVFRKSSPGTHVPYLNARRVLLEYVLEEQTTEVGWFLQGTDNNTYFVLTYHLRRLYGYHVLNSFFPSLLMFFISYATFFFQLEDFTNRMMISLTAQLVLAALFTSTTQSSVRTPYLKLIDLWYAAIITFCFIIIIIQTIINVVLHSGRLLPHAITRVQPLQQLYPSKVEPLVEPVFTRRGSGRLHPSPTTTQLHPPPGHTTARLWNATARVLLLVSLLVFLVLYGFMAAGLLHTPTSSSSTAGAAR